MSSLTTNIITAICITNNMDTINYTLARGIFTYNVFKLVNNRALNSFL